ncbi:DUF1573 domain-containing protein [Flaviaesturariibacter flavus]|uniref:DUF1573 domain-containing protein n=1 Tax=Flaviaesturariibacter flavus TaxID=2502780 RepID=A0A4R1BJZ5_9BACT|nr:DUF1573 domain-containing protein [Flaviaesturariibacter flavus]TCJ17680.1 DUF1573 domain-containing protein [Flaviaesturariibacter flavus]
MKRFLIASALFFAAFSGHAQSAADTSALRLPELEFDFGKIPQGKPVFHRFEVVNGGVGPLVLSNVQASCGCTTPEWDREHPIAAGSKGEIKVGYNAAANGPFEKIITITYNGSGTKVIKIKGEVWQAPAGPAPVNQSVQFLKQQIQ